MKNIYTATAKANRKAEITFNKILLLLLLTLVQMGVLHAQDNVNLVIKDVVMGKSEASATTSITLKDGFRAVAGSDFRAYISASAPAPVGVTNLAPGTPSWTTPVAGTNTMNYVKTISYLEAQTSVPTGAFKHLAEIQYFDGLGRPVQTVGVKASPLQKDVIQPFVYDNYGREAKKVLPYVDDANTGDYRSGITNDVLTPVVGYYNQNKEDDKPYSQITFDNSPLNRVVAQRGPGKDWETNDKKTTISYLANTEAKTGWNVTGDFSYASFSYPAGSLYVTETTDEQGTTTREYKDKQGQVVIKESKLGNEWLTTTYVYDDFGLLRAVIPPKASNPNTETGLCYRYRYDERNRMVEKQIPGAGPVLMVYDARDRLRFTQNALQRSANPIEWSFTKYDELNRPVITGILKGQTISQINTALAQGAQNETRTDVTAYYGYNNASYPTSAQTTEVYTVTFYDDYNFLTPVFGNSDFFKSDMIDLIGYSIGDKLDNTPKGRVTGNITRVLKSQNETYTTRPFIYDVNYYDKYGKLLRSSKQNHHLGGYTIITNIYEDVTNLLVKSVQDCRMGTGVLIEKNFEYDHTGRLLATRLKVNNQPEITLNAMKYNELGELVQKFLHSNGTSGNRVYKQKVDYSYNIRGWLTQINDPTLGSDNDLFGMQLFYQNTTNLGGLNGATSQYNGNIAGMKWNIFSDKVRGYKFAYDELNRLKTSEYAEGSSLNENANAYNEKVTEYDKNGNIVWLYRWNNGNFVDLLNYTYSSGNQLAGIRDFQGDWANINDYPGITNDSKLYLYDANGNMKKDGAKNVDIEYNSVLNLPLHIYENTKDLYYHYSASGTKLLKHMGNNYTFYDGNLVFEGDRLSYIITEEGRLVEINKSGDLQFAYEYNLKDHLGNNRVTFTGASLGNGIDVAQTSSYYPFGLNMVQNNINNNSSYPKNKYLYNGKELQDEFFESQKLDWLDYGARFYDPQIGRWHSVDPLAEGKPWMSSYVYCSNNPIHRIDPDGRWDVDKYGNLVAEKGDNAWSLARFQNIKPQEAIKQLKDQGYTINDKGILNLKIGDKVTLDNVYTKNLKSEGDLPKGDSKLDYNCWGSTLAGIEGKEIKVGVGINHPVTFDTNLENNFTSIDAKNAVFGKTALRFTTDHPYSEKQFDSYEKAGQLSRDPNAVGGNLHGAVYYGKNHAGETYIYTKNGWGEPPRIMKLKDLENNTYYEYGTVRGLKGGSGYYLKK